MDKLEDPGLHLLQPAGRVRRPHRDEGEGSRATTSASAGFPFIGNGKAIALGEAGRPGEDDLRQEDRPAARRAPGRRGSDRADPGLRDRHEPRDDRGRADPLRLPASDAVGDDARKRSCGLRTCDTRMATKMEPRGWRGGGSMLSMQRSLTQEGVFWRPSPYSSCCRCLRRLRRTPATTCRPSDNQT